MIRRGRRTQGERRFRASDRRIVASDRRKGPSGRRRRRPDAPRGAAAAPDRRGIRTSEGASSPKPASRRSPRAARARRARPSEPRPHAGQTAAPRGTRHRIEGRKHEQPPAFARRHPRALARADRVRGVRAARRVLPSVALISRRRGGDGQLPRAGAHGPLADRHPRLHAATRHRHGVRAARVLERGLARVHIGRGVHAVPAPAGAKHLGVLQRRRGLAGPCARRRARQVGVRRGASRDVARLARKRVRRAVRARARRLRLAQRRRRVARAARAARRAVAPAGRRAPQPAVLRGQGVRGHGADRRVHEGARSRAGARRRARGPRAHPRGRALHRRPLRTHPHGRRPRTRRVHEPHEVQAVLQSRHRLDAHALRARGGASPSPKPCCASPTCPSSRWPAPWATCAQAASASCSGARRGFSPASTAQRRAEPLNGNTARRPAARHRAEKRRPRGPTRAACAARGRRLAESVGRGAGGLGTDLT